MLLITSSRDIVWTVPSSLDGTDLYLVADNRPGPSGGGAGNTANRHHSSTDPNSHHGPHNNWDPVLWNRRCGQ